MGPDHSSALTKLVNNKANDPQEKINIFLFKKLFIYNIFFKNVFKIKISFRLQLGHIINVINRLNMYLFVHIIRAMSFIFYRNASNS
jgi:hypothetical protein